MSSPSRSSDTPATQPSTVRNWISLSGFVLLLASLFAFILLFSFDLMASHSNPYVGILTYLVAPSFFFLGLSLVLLGAWLRHRKLAQAGNGSLRIDLANPRDRRLLAWFSAGGVTFLMFTGIATYHSYHFTESVRFCGQVCHTVMKPELVSYQHSPHARVACTECHIGKGATWYVRSKLSGLYQVYATMADKFPRPVPTPVKNLRPAQETCEQCHWPQKFVGNLDRTYNYFIGNETNTPYSIRLLLKVGGGETPHGPAGGIHWHMNVANKIEYIATDEARQKIPWVRMTDSKGVVTEFRSPQFTNDPSQHVIRRMDCMDCHNRPAHHLKSPEYSVNQALALGRLDRGMPWIKTNALHALTRSYKTEAEALQNIANFLTQRYPNDTRVGKAIESVQQIYKDNFFPEMKASWQSYPDNIGHMEWNGCFRCHDGKHKAADGKRSIQANDCNTCHTILTQGRGAELDQLTPAGQPFKHPEEEYDPAFLCTDCHNGGI